LSSVARRPSPASGRSRFARISPFTAERSEAIALRPVSLGRMSNVIGRSPTAGPSNCQSPIADCRSGLSPPSAGEASS